MYFLLFPGTSSTVIGNPPSLLNCTLIRDFGAVQPLSQFLLLGGSLLLLLAILVGLTWCCGSCCSCKAACGVIWVGYALAQLFSWLVYTILYLPAAFSDWLVDRDSCSDLIMIFTVIVALFTLIVAMIYVGIIIIGISYGLYLKCCAQKRENKIYT